MANMAPEYGATMGFFPVDDQTLAYLRLTGRDAKQIDLVEQLCPVFYQTFGDKDMIYQAVLSDD